MSEWWYYDTIRYATINGGIIIFFNFMYSTVRTYVRSSIMVKPSKSMQPENVDLKRAGRKTGSGAAFGEDSFHNYMALKIAGQRDQFGLIIPPPPKPQLQPPSEETLQDSDDDDDDDASNQKFSSFPTPATRQVKSTVAKLVAAKIGLASTQRATAVIASLKNSNPSYSSIISKRPTLLERRSLLTCSSQLPFPSNSDDQIIKTTVDVDDVDDVDVDGSKCTNTASSMGYATTDRSVHFAEGINPTEKGAATARPEKKKKKTKMESMIHRLKRRHGRGNRKLENKKKERSKTTKHNGQEEKQEEENCNRRNFPVEPVLEQEDNLTELARIFSAAEDDDDSNNRSDHHERKDNEGVCEQQVTQTEKAIVAFEGASAIMAAEDSLTELARIFSTADDDPFLSFDHDGSQGNDEGLCEQQQGSWTTTVATSTSPEIAAAEEGMSTAAAMTIMTTSSIGISTSTSTTPSPKAYENHAQIYSFTQSL